MQAKILVVEDEAITAMDIKRTLENRGFEVVATASRGEEAIKKAEELKPDLVLMDIILKGDMDGIEAADKIMTLFDIPVVYLTAHTDKDTFDRAKLTKPYGFITKPVNQDGLEGTIETSLYKHELDKKLAESEKLYYEFFDNPITALTLCEIILNGEEPVDFVYLEVNKTFEDYIGHKREEVLNRRATDVFLHEEVARIIKVCGKVALTGESIEFKHTFPSLGKIFDMAAFSPGKNYFITIFTDITEQKKADEVLELSSEWLNLAQYAANAGFWEWDIYTGKLTWSDALYNLFDIDPNEEATFDMWFSVMNPDDHEMAMNNINTAIEERKFLKNEFRIIHSDGTEHWIKSLGNTVYDDKGKPERMSGICLDITNEKQAELERDTTIEFLQLVNESKGINDLIQRATKFFQRQSSFNAVGIRLKEGDDYPYFEARGFPEEFIEAENWLCSYDEKGNIILDNEGKPMVECMCGNVISGRFDPSKPFFTENGSFWTNSTTELLATTTDEDRLARTRNRCNNQGYESLALIPLHSGENKLGLLQLNEQKKGMLSQDKIAFWERLAGYLAIALEKFMAERELKEAKDNLELKIQERTKEIKYHADLLENVNDAIIATDENYVITSWNKAAERIYGWKSEEVLGKDSVSILQVEYHNADNEEMIQSIIKKGNFKGETVHKRKDGSTIAIESTVMQMKDYEGNITGYVAVNRDVSERKNSEN